MTNSIQICTTEINYVRLKRGNQFHSILLLEGKEDIRSTFCRLIRKNSLSVSSIQRKKKQGLLRTFWFVQCFRKEIEVIVIEISSVCRCLCFDIEDCRTLSLSLSLSPTKSIVWSKHIRLKNRCSIDKILWQ